MIVKVFIKLINNNICNSRLKQQTYYIYDKISIGKIIMARNNKICDVVFIIL